MKIPCFALIASLASSAAWAGVYTDDLAKCLVDGTTSDDRAALVKWMFTSASAHPAISSLSKVTTEDIEAANQVAGTLFMRLMTETCRVQTQKALKYEGPTTIQLSFTVLGQVAGTELFAHPTVTANMSGLEKYVDGRKIEAMKSEPIPGG